MVVDTTKVRALCSDFPARIAAPRFCKDAKALLREMADELDDLRDQLAEHGGPAGSDEDEWRLDVFLVDVAEPLVAVKQLEDRLSRPGALDVPRRELEVARRRLRAAQHPLAMLVRRVDHALRQDVG